MTEPHTLTDARTMIEKDYLGQWDFDDGKGGYIEVTVTISSVERYRPPVVRKSRDGTPEKNKRIVIGFTGKNGKPIRKKWLAGPVSITLLVGMFGRFVERWIGRKVTLYADPSVKFGRKTVGGVRVRSTADNNDLTDEPLDNPVNDDLRAIQDEAFGHEGEVPETEK